MSGMRKQIFKSVVISRIAKDGKQRFELICDANQLSDDEYDEIDRDIHSSYRVFRSGPDFKLVFSKMYAILPAIRACICQDIVITDNLGVEVDKATLLKEIEGAFRAKLEKRTIPAHHFLLEDFDALVDEVEIEESTNSVKFIRNRKDGEIYLLKLFNEFPDSRIIEIEAMLSEMHRFALGFDRAISSIPVFDSNKKRIGLAVKFLPNAKMLYDDYTSSNDYYYRKLFDLEIVRFYAVAFFLENVDFHFCNVFITENRLVVFDFDRALWSLTCKYVHMSSDATDEYYKTPPGNTFIFNPQAIKKRFLKLTEPYNWANSQNIQSNLGKYDMADMTSPDKMQSLPGCSQQKYLQFLKNILMPFSFVQKIVNNFIGSPEFRNMRNEYYKNRMQIQRHTLLSIKEFREFLFSGYGHFEKILDEFDLYFQNSAIAVRPDSIEQKSLITQIINDFMHLQQQARLYTWNFYDPNLLRITPNLKIEIINYQLREWTIGIAISAAMFLKLDFTETSMQILVAFGKLATYEQQRDNPDYKAERMVRGIKAYLCQREWDVSKEKNAPILFHRPIPARLKNEWDKAAAACQQADLNPQNPPDWQATKNSIFHDLAEAHSRINLFSETNKFYGKFRSETKVEKLIFNSSK